MPKFIPSLKLNEMFYHFARQHLLGVTRGALFSDGLGQLEPIRQKLAYFPHDVWLYLLVAQWARIGQEEHFMGRAGDVGDEIGSQLLAARLVHDIIRFGCVSFTL